MIYGGYIKSSAPGDRGVSAMNPADGTQELHMHLPRTRCLLTSSAPKKKRFPDLISAKPENAEAYGIDMAEGYIFISASEGAASHVYAFSKSDGSQVMKQDSLEGSDNYAGIVYAGG